jgi:NADPH:quinone reductase-like Zn-dependent oxidoreductase
MLWEELDEPSCAADEVVVDVHACGLNHSDLDSRAGTSRWPFALPWVLGAEFAGVISQVGSDVTGLAVGDSVPAVRVRPLRRLHGLAS